MCPKSLQKEHRSADALISLSAEMSGTLVGVGNTIMNKIRR